MDMSHHRQTGGINIIGGGTEKDMRYHRQTGGSAKEVTSGSSGNKTLAREMTQMTTTGRFVLQSEVALLKQHISSEGHILCVFIQDDFDIIVVLVRCCSSSLFTFSSELWSCHVIVPSDSSDASRSET